MSRAYYNEHDPHAAAWLRELIKDGQIADGNAIVPAVAAEVIGAYLEASA